jgi:hypothetical protein
MPRAEQCENKPWKPYSQAAQACLLLAGRRFALHEGGPLEAFLGAHLPRAASCSTSSTTAVVLPVPGGPAASLFTS